MSNKTYIWNLVSTDMGYALECSKCKHKISIKGYIIADKMTDICPFCESTMKLDDLDYDKIYELAQGEADVN